MLYEGFLLTMIKEVAIKARWFYIVDKKVPHKNGGF